MSEGRYLLNDLYGDAFRMAGTVRGGDDKLTGGEMSGGSTLANTIRGDASQMYNSTRGGDDVLTGGNNSGSGIVTNRMLGEGDEMYNSARGGDDVLHAGRSTSAGKVINEMWGDAQAMFDASQGGSDTFVFENNIALGQTVGAENYIYDFSQRQHDTIHFVGVAGVTAFSDLWSEASTYNGIASTIIHAGAEAVTLVGFTGALTASDFWFG
jgi:hypothetical protein